MIGSRVAARGLTTVGAREPLEGVELPVGKPTLLHQGLSTRVVMEHRRWTVISAHALLPAAGGPPRVMLLLLRVDPAG